MRSRIKNCSGCKACENICPADCLKIDTTQKYNFYKEIDEDKCMKCGKCIAVCPMKKATPKEPLKAIIAWNKKRKIAKNSSSGGIAASIYLYCLKNNIDCVGVLFNDVQELRYEFICNDENVFRAAGSKYTYSDMNNIYRRIKERLNSGKRVVFIGLPCHVSGLLNFCEEEQLTLQNLYTVDLVCHGVPMPRVLREHIADICKKKHIQEPVEVFSREKDNPFGLTIKKNHKLIYKKSRYEDTYMIAYIKGYYMRSCYKCLYATKKRCGDITLKDCSAGTNVKMKERPLYNASEVLVNSWKGMELFEKINNGSLYSQDAVIENVVKEDILLQHPTKYPRLYKIFYTLEKKVGFEIAIQLLYGLKMKWDSICGKTK